MGLCATITPASTITTTSTATTTTCLWEGHDKDDRECQEDPRGQDQQHAGCRTGNRKVQAVAMTPRRLAPLRVTAPL